MKDGNGAPFDEALAEVNEAVADGRILLEPVFAFAPADYQQAFSHGVLVERARIRGIVFRLFGNDWHGNEALRLIDEG